MTPRRRRMSRRTFLGAAGARARATAALCALLLAVGGPLLLPHRAEARPAAKAHRTHTVTYDKYSLSVDGRRTTIWGGEFAYWRLPSPSGWRDVLEKMKAGGFNAVSIYFDWDYHSPAPGVYDFSGVRNVDQLLDIADEVGIYVIARQGPYINAETDGGGFPGWLNRMGVRERTTDPAYLRYADEWLTRIDTIIARHQLTNGTGTVILDQVENELRDGSADARAYMKHIEDKYRADGITVPLTGNHDGIFNSGEGAVDIDGWDSYSQGVPCDPQHWGQVPDYSAQRQALTDRPLFMPEYQAGAWDPWGGVGYEKCRQMSGADFEKVFYDTSIAAGATMQSFYMTYGGTSWGYLPEPDTYTSYDYGAAIAEDRELTDKYAQQKLTGYLLAAVPSLAKTDTLPGAAQTNPDLWIKGRVNPDDKTQLYVLRQADGTSDTPQRTHMTVDLGDRTGFTHDDTDAAVHYGGTGWSHYDGQVAFRQTASWSEHTGDSVSVTFTGPSVRWIGFRDFNHGITEVSIDGKKVADVDEYSATKQTQQTLYRADGLSDGEHTLTLTVTGRKNAKSAGAYSTLDAVDVPPAPGADFYPSVPQEPGTSLAVDGRDAKMLLADYAFGGQKLVYSTSQLMTRATIDGTDTAVLYAPKGDDGETVLRYASRPTVQVRSGSAKATWDAARGDLRLNYVHGGLTEVRISGGGRPPADLLLADTDTAKRFWREDTSAGPVLARGPELVRTGTADHGTLALTGDTDAPTTLSLWAPSALTRVTWNGRPVRGGRTDLRLDGPRPVTMPTLDWRTAPGSPETAAGYDDSSWRIADRTGTDNPNGAAGVPVLYSDDYGFHAGDVWYRGHFTATGTETGIALAAQTGNSTGQYAAWLNGRCLGTANDAHTFDLPKDALRPGTDNVLAVLVANMGHNEGTGMAVRGLTSARLSGSTAAVTWRIQGGRGGEDPVDPVRGPLNTGGLSGERDGATLPGYPDGSWRHATLPAAHSTPGVTWYRTQFNPAVPKDQDVPVALRFTDDLGKHYRVQIYLNGWNMGLYVNDVGPQHDFPLPAGLLRPDGRNTLALAVWSNDDTSGLGRVSLVAQANLRGGVPVSPVASPAYDAHRYAEPAAPAQVRLTAPDTMTPGTGAEVTATVSVPKGRPAVRSARVTLKVPDGWRLDGPGTVPLGRITPGEERRVTWTVTARTSTDPNRPWGSVLVATAGLDGREVSDGQTVTVPPPAPSGTAYVSDLPFTATNGWGPVERDTSNGEQAPGDGRPITVGGQQYAKGIGTNSVSDVTVFTGGQCTAFTATVGIDAESNGGGSVTFTVLADGVPKETTAVLRADSAPVDLNVDVTGADYVDLLVGDGGDNNGLDHADWADARLHCG
ncbi:Beta-galactosidase, domain 3 [Actinacidiphila alni]|uniref:beta-galactosidase n=1 Tax=Actinacidiphila alni TaxID=380248 RepID=A0A1I2HP12_9ACTN|nr:beta-galactosidase [Actinacidiphila alni]SFF32085.1 Beta-galactosidase, domain 3 [Actinacidiphila alni]